MKKDTQPVPPVAPIRPHILVDHGVRRSDPYYWLRHREDPAVGSYLEAENAYAEAFMAPSGDWQDRLYAELIARLEEDYESAPHREGNYYYHYRYEAGREYRIYCRRQGSLDAPEEVYLDSNALAEGHAYFEIGYLQIAPNGSLLAVAYDTSGDERYILRFKDLRSGEWLPDEMPLVNGDSGEWSADSSFFFYTVDEAENQRPFRVIRHELETPSEEDAVVYEDADPLFFVGIEKSQDGRYLFASSESKTTGEASFLPADDPKGPFELLLPRRKEVRYYPEHHDGCFLLRTNDNARNFKLVSLPVADRAWENTVEILPHDDQVDLMDLFPLAEYLVLFVRIRGVDQVRIRRWCDGETSTVEFPEPVHVLTEAINVEYDTHLLNLVYDSPITPTTTFQVDLRTFEQVVLKQARVPRGHRPEDYTAYRVEVAAADGVAVPMTIFHRKEVKLDGSAPCYLYGYGSYGVTSDPHFSRSRLSYLERGFVCAIAHVRGGGLLGESWYEAGKLLAKKNTFSDFEACAQYLVDQSFTSPDRLAIHGASAGGLLVGTVINSRPDLFAVAVAEVPFVDTVTTMLDESIPLTTFEWEEWGDPREKEYFDYMLDYSPYDNVRPQRYPALLVTAGLNDPRVQYWEPAKWVAKLRATATGGGPILLKTHLGAGHDGASGRYESYRERAFEQAFIFGQLGLER